MKALKENGYASEDRSGELKMKLKNELKNQMKNVVFGASYTSYSSSG